MGMKKCSVMFLVSMGILLCAVKPAAADVSNVAAGKKVTLSGTFFTNGWAGASVPADEQERANTLVDGAFLPRSSEWDGYTVWWGAHPENYITIDLGGQFNIESFAVQADDNDAYMLDYWNGDNWARAWDINVAGGWGMQTRPNPANDAERYTLTETINTNALKLYWNPAAGDGLCSISEIQAYGLVAPEPMSATLIVLGSAVLGLSRFRRKTA